ncbi:MAG: hypothetical protein QOG86_977 [Thermoleophilaceae bacterium]|nr:hypothetical protein [Thermoleophilaceae bacterium]
MESAFAIVLFVVVGVAIVAAVIALVTSGGAYGQIGRGGMSIGDERQASGGPAAPPGMGGVLTPGQAAEREAEVRQMLEARNARRAARGQPAGDVDAELAELLRGPAAAAAAIEPGIEAEVRQLVESRNARRVSRGEEPLDVEAEVRRRLEGLA